ncbi:MAG: hypothetical protein ABMA13_00765 [Chthoniobacteraceae bacterium]
MLALITTSHAGWFDRKDDHKQEIQQLHQQLAVEQKQTGTWQIVAGSLAVFTFIAFTIGTILGSRTRRKHERAADTHQQ